MRPQEIRKIVENELSKHTGEPNTLKILFAVRKKLAETIFDELAPAAPAHYREQLLKLEDAVRPFNILQALCTCTKHAEIYIETVEEIVRLFEQWQDALKFLIEEYDALPADLQNEWHKSCFVEVAAYAHKRHDEVFNAFGAELTSPIYQDDVRLLQSSITCVRWAALGSNQQLQQYLNRFSEAWSAATLHISRFQAPPEYP